VFCSKQYNEIKISFKITDDCLRAQTDQLVFKTALKKIFLVGGCRFFVSDLMSEVVFGSFWLMLPGLGPNCYAKVFHWSFHWKQGSIRVFSAFDRVSSVSGSKVM